MCSTTRLVSVAMAICLVGSPLVRAVGAQAQSTSNGATVYRSTASAVFLIEVRDDTGAVVGIGSAFLMQGGRLVTNAHVVRGGRPFLRTGAVRLPLTVERIDTQNDLAVLRSATPLDAPELALATTEPPIGTPVFALGNPKGLERSISEGLVSGVREVNERRLLQITAAISPGSSGGPIVTRDGQVVGVAVGFLEHGQNLNFAVPAEQVRALLTGPAEGNGAQLAVAIADAQRLLQKGPPEYRDSAAANRYWRDVAAAVRVAGASARTGDEYLAVAAIASHGLESGETVRLAEEAIRRGTAHPDSARQILLNTWSIQLIVRDTMSPATLRHMLAVADTAIGHAPARANGYAFRARILGRLGAGERAIADAATAVERGEGTHAVGWYWSIYHETAHQFGSTSVENSVFRRMVAASQADGSDWTAHAEHLVSRKDWLLAAEAYARAYLVSERGRAESSCEAGRMFFMADSVDRSLGALRTCVREYATAVRVDTVNLAVAHRLMAVMMNARGVYAQAESHAREALALGSDARAYAELSDALRALKRPSEAAAAAEQAIRVSDGAIADMHFAAGAAYFDLQDWPRCVSAYTKADELGSTGTAAAYNTGLCLAKQGFYRDAARAMENVLRRDPKRSDRADVESLIRRWRQ